MKGYKKNNTKLGKKARRGNASRYQPAREDYSSYSNKKNKTGNEGKNKGRAFGGYLNRGHRDRYRLSCWAAAANKRTCLGDLRL